jgi:hypothetical protein
VDRLLGEYRVPKDSAAGRLHFAEAMEARRQGEKTQEFKAVRRGWCLGDKAFRKELLAQMGEGRGTNHYGEEGYESDVAKAERIVADELRRETTMTLKWVAERLVMRSWSIVSNRLVAARKRA